MTNEASELHKQKVIQTCGKCHLFIQQRLQASVHRWDEDGDAQQERRLAPGGTTAERPVCTSCHAGHDFGDPRSVSFRETLPGRCGNCHERLSEQYLMSLHGQLTNLGHGPAAKCSDCHRAHDILAVSNPQSHVFGENRIETCTNVIPVRTRTLPNSILHADHHDPERSRFLQFRLRWYGGLAVFRICFLRNSHTAVVYSVDYLSHEAVAQTSAAAPWRTGARVSRQLPSYIARDRHHFILRGSGADRVAAEIQRASVGQCTLRQRWAVSSRQAFGTAFVH